MEYARYKPIYQRPFGKGAFFDFGLAMAGHLAARAARASARRKKSPALPPVQQGAEERWDAEGGNSPGSPGAAARYER